MRCTRNLELNCQMEARANTEPEQLNTTNFSILTTGLEPDYRLHSDPQISYLEGKGFNMLLGLCYIIMLGGPNNKPILIYGRTGFGS